MKLYNNTIKKVGKSCQKYSLLEKGDKILVGLSGGKDSLFLMEALHVINRKLVDKVEIVACHIHIKEVGYKVDKEFLQQFCADLNIPLIYEEISADLIKNPKKAPCFVCSWYRRKKLFEISKELNCNKLALGHHADDAIETLFINMVYHGSISSIPAKLKMFDGRLMLIRPLLEQYQSELIKIAEIREYPLPIYECPYGKGTKRTEIRNLIDQISAMNPNARKNIFRSMDEVFFEYLPGGL